MIQLPKDSVSYRPGMGVRTFIRGNRDSGAVVPSNLTLFLPMGDAAGAGANDVTGRGNSVSSNNVVPRSSTVRFRVGANSNAVPSQKGTFDIAGLGGWNGRISTLAERNALLGGEKWPFLTTTSLQDAAFYYLFDESGGSTSYIDATSRGNDLSVDAGTTGSVSGPSGFSAALRLDGNTILGRSITDDLGSDSDSWFYFGWINIRARGSTQQIVCGQISLDGPNIVSRCVYFHESNNRMNVDLGAGDFGGLSENGVAVATNYGDIPSDEWIPFFVEYNHLTKALRIEIDGVSETPLDYNRYAQPISGATSFNQDPLFTILNGWDAYGGVHFRCGTTNDLKIGNNAKGGSIRLKLEESFRTQTIIGFYNRTYPGAVQQIDWALQQHQDILYLLGGNSAGTLWAAGVPLTDTSSEHTVTFWFDKNGDGKHWIDLDDGTQVASATPTVTPASGLQDFIMGAKRFGVAFDEGFSGTVRNFFMFNGVPQAADRTYIHNGGLGSDYARIVAGTGRVWYTG